MGEGDGYTDPRQDRWKKTYGQVSNADYIQNYLRMHVGKKASKAMTYWADHGQQFTNESFTARMSSVYGADSDQFRNISALMSGDKNTWWKDGVKYERKNQNEGAKSWGTRYWEPAKGYEVSYKTEVGDDGVIRKTAINNQGFAGYGPADWSRTGSSKSAYKSAKAYQKASQKNLDEYHKTFPAPAPPSEDSADAPSTTATQSDQDTTGARKVSDMTIAKKRKELGAPGAGSSGGGSGLGVSY